MQEPPLLPSSSSSSHSSSREASSPAMACYRAQVLEGDYSVYDIGQPPSSQQKRQLDVLPISAYGWDSDLPSGSGRLIAANYSYVCYCLRASCSIRILGRNVPSRGLFQGHTQRVTDMELFAKDDVNLVASVSLDGRLFIWKIVENFGGDDDFQLQHHVILAIQFEKTWKDACPRVCWHPQSQEILIVSMNNQIFKLNLEKARTKTSQAETSEEAILSCSSANLIDGVSCIGNHDSEVTDLSVFSDDVLYVASACNDGMVRVWEDCKASPVAVLMPHDGQPVGSVFFFTCSSQPEKAVLLTTDMAKEKLKLWVPVLSSRFCTWHLVQTLEFRRCNGSCAEKVLSNPICTIPQAGFIVIGNSETPALYSVHLKFSSALNAMQMDFIAEFSLSMPILSFTSVAETGSSCKDMAHVFCVQTQAIQEYLLNISDCVSPHCDEPARISSSAALLDVDFKKVSVHEDVGGEQERKRLTMTASNMTAKEVVELATGNSNSGSGFGSWVEVPNWIAATVKRNLKSVSPLASGHCAGSNLSSMEGPESLSRTASHMCARLSPLPSSSFLPAISGSSEIEESRLLPVGLDGLPGIDSESLNHDVISRTRSDLASEHCLYTPTIVNHQNSESTRSDDSCMILSESRAASCSETTAIVTVQEIKPDFLFAVKEDYKEHQEELASRHMESPSNNNIKKKRGRWRRRGSDKTNRGTTSVSLPNLASEDMPLVCRSQEDARTGNLQIEDDFHVTQSACPSPSYNEEDLSVQLTVIKESVDHLLTTQTELQKSLSSVIEVRLCNEIVHADAVQDDWITNHFGSHLDILWRQSGVKLSDMNSLHLDWIGQLQKILDDILTEEFLSAPKSVLSSEMLSRVGSNLSVVISASVDNLLVTSLPPVLEGWNNKFFKYLEKSLGTILSSSIREQMESLLIGFWKHLIQEEVSSIFCEQAVMKVETTCGNMIEHGHCLSNDGIVPNFCLVEQHVNSAVLGLLSRLKDTLLAFSGLAHALNEKLQAVEKNIRHSTEISHAKYDLYEEILQMLQQGRLEDAFTVALSVGSSSVTTWICRQVDLKTLLTKTSPPPLSERIILLLLQELAADVGDESTDKLAWMEQACLALVPDNRPCMRSSLEQVYVQLQRQTPLFATNVRLANQARLVMHLLNSLMTYCS